MCVPALDFGPSHLETQNGPSTEKELVVVRSLVLAFPDPFKVVEVELSLEAGHPAHAKVSGHKVCHETVGVVNEKGSPVRQKGGDLGTTRQGLEVF